MRDVGEEAAMTVLRRTTYFGCAVDGYQRDAEALRRIGDGVLGLVPDPFGESAVKRRDLFGRDGELEPIVVEIVEPTRISHEFLEVEPVAAARHIQVDMPVATA